MCDLLFSMQLLVFQVFYAPDVYAGGDSTVCQGFSFLFQFSIMVSRVGFDTHALACSIIDIHAYSTRVYLYSYTHVLVYSYKSNTHDAMLLYSYILIYSLNILLYAGFFIMVFRLELELLQICF